LELNKSGSFQGFRFLLFAGNYVIKSRDFIWKKAKSKKLKEKPSKTN